LTHEEPGAGAIWLARRMARRRNGLFRAPHHTVSGLGLISELAISAGGTLLLDEAIEFRRSGVRQLLSTWRAMPKAIRPDLVLACLVPADDPYAEKRCDELLELLPGERIELNVRRPKDSAKPEVTRCR
jgi:hypothetical protein